MSLRLEGALVAALSFAAACEKSENRRSPDLTDSAVAPISAASTARPDAGEFHHNAAAPHAATTPTWSFDCDELATPKAGKSVGHTSVVFKLELSNGKKAAWKPNARKVKGRYRGEIATYRLARALSIPNVPPACLRVFDAKTAAAALAAHPDGAKLFADEVIADHGKINGVVIPWIDGLKFWPLEKEPLASEVRSWLTDKTIPPAKMDLARQASDLIVLDFITGNWDRYSGENVGLDATGTHVLFIDNDAAFMEGPPTDLLARSRARLSATQRFSRHLIAAVRELDEAHLVAALGDESPGQPLIPKGVIERVVARRRELLVVVDTKSSRQGEAATLYFP